MAEFSKQIALTFLTDEDLSSSAYRVVLLGTDNLVGITTSTTVPATGITTDNVEDGSSTSAPVTVAVSGVAKAEVGAAVNAGVALMAATGGKVITCTSGNVAIGMALSTGGADGDIISVLIDRYEMT
jgi:hypothetical protein